MTLVAARAEAQDQRPLLQWRTHPNLPTAVAGQFVGVSNKALIVAGGAHFPTPLFEGGVKQWIDEISILEPGAAQWKTGFRLDAPLAYGVAVSDGKRMICIGGGDADEHSSRVFELRWRDGTITSVPLPDLPRPCAFMGGALLDDVVYVAGGMATPDATEGLRTFWSLNLKKLDQGWRQLDPWPGPGRILPVVAAQDGGIYLVSGAELSPGPEGKPRRRYLRDGYRFKTGAGWKPIADIPRAAVAAPSIEIGPYHLLVFGGDDGANADRVQELGDAHPGFPRDILAYHTVTNTWIRVGELSESLATVNAVRWQKDIVIAGGEDRPGHRSSRVWHGVARKPASHFSRLDFAVLAFYLLTLLLMGVYFSRRERGTEDFFLAGRRIPWWAAGMSIFGTQLSAITFIAAPAKIYATDWLYFLGGVTLLLVMPVVVYCFLPFYRRLNVTTAYEYLEKRFNVAVRLFGSAAFVLFQLGRMSIVLYLPAIALATVTGIDVIICILLMGVLATAYTVMGGIEAVIWTDVIQVVVLMGGALLCLGVIVADVGGFGQVIAVGQANQKFRTFLWSWDSTQATVWVVVFGTFLANLAPYTADQAVIQRYLTTRDEKQAARSIWANAALVLPSSLLFYFVGTALYVYYQGHPEQLEPTLQADSLFPWFIAWQLPSGLTGLVVAGIFAASMSSLDSSLNSVATAVVTDFYRRFRPGVSDHRCLNLARWLTVLLGVTTTVVAVVLVSIEIESLWDLFMQILGLLMGSLTGVFILGIFTRRANSVGALTGAIVSAFVLAGVQNFTPLHFFLYAGIGIITCVSVGYAVSLFTPPQGDTEGLTIYSLPPA